ncbi:MAG: hypothetical protein WCG75_01435 [Armatimonadota bacterium]
MLLAALVTIPLHNIQAPKVVETKLFRNQKGVVAPGSITVSPNLDHYSYSTIDHKVIIDGKAFGPYVSNGAVLYSGDSKDYAFLANLKVNAPPTVFWNGVPKTTEFPVTSVFRAGETGGICWGERKVTVEPDPKDPKKEIRNEFTRLIHPGGVTEWFDKVEKIYFSDDGSSFALRINEKIPLKDIPADKPNAPTSRDYIILADGTKRLRGNTMQIFPAPNNQGYAVLDTDFSETTDYSFEFRNKLIEFKGEFSGKPIFSPDGKQFAFRRSFTGPTPGGTNIAFYQYTIGGYSIPDLQIQTGLTYAPDGKKWVMSGLNGRTPYLYVSSMGMVSYGEFPGLALAPPEPYKMAKFANGKIVLLFQPKREKPSVFIEDKGVFELGPFTSLPDTMSVSPNGRYMVIGGADLKETRAFMIDLENPATAVEVMKPGCELQVLGKGTFVWKSNSSVQFMILKNSELVRVNASF